MALPEPLAGIKAVDVPALCAITSEHQALDWGGVAASGTTSGQASGPASSSLLPSHRLAEELSKLDVALANEDDGVPRVQPPRNHSRHLLHPRPPRASGEDDGPGTGSTSSPAPASPRRRSVELPSGRGSSSAIEATGMDSLARPSNAGLSSIAGRSNAGPGSRNASFILRSEVARAEAGGTAGALTPRGLRLEAAMAAIHPTASHGDLTAAAATGSSAPASPSGGHTTSASGASSAGVLSTDVVSPSAAAAVAAVRAASGVGGRGALTPTPLGGSRPPSITTGTTGKRGLAAISTVVSGAAGGAVVSPDALVPAAVKLAKHVGGHAGARASQDGEVHGSVSGATWTKGKSQRLSIDVTAGALPSYLLAGSASSTPTSLGSPSVTTPKPHSLDLTSPASAAGTTPTSIPGGAPGAQRRGSLETLPTVPAALAAAAAAAQVAAAAATPRVGTMAMLHTGGQGTSAAADAATAAAAALGTPRAGARERRASVSSVTGGAAVQGSSQSFSVGLGGKSRRASVDMSALYSGLLGPNPVGNAMGASGAGGYTHGTSRASITQDAQTKERDGTLALGSASTAGRRKSISIASEGLSIMKQLEQLEHSYGLQQDGTARAMRLLKDLNTDPDTSGAASEWQPAVQLSSKSMSAMATTRHASATGSTLASLPPAGAGTYMTGAAPASGGAGAAGGQKQHLQHKDATMTDKLLGKLSGLLGR